MCRTAAKAGAARPLAVLAVLLGLLAMHGLASAHHAAASSPAHHGAHAAPAAASAHRDAAPTPDTVSSAVHDAVALVGGTSASCDDDCSSVAMLCVAVLTGAALALLLARRRPAPLLLAPAQPTARAPTPPTRHAPGPDPVRELCVSRT